MGVEKSFCRLCFAFCGMDVTVDDNGRVLQVRGDRDNPLTRRYACVKGLDAPEAPDGALRSPFEQTPPAFQTPDR